MKNALLKKFASKRLETIGEESENDQDNIQFKKINDQREEIKENKIKKILGVV